MKAAARRVVLAVTAIVFFGIALGSLVVPAQMAVPLGYALTNVNALSEFRAIYVGLWLAHVVIFGWAAWRVDRVVLGDVAAILLLGQVVGRLLSLGLDGLPTAGLWPVSIAELLGGVALLLLRPAARAGA